MSNKMFYVLCFFAALFLYVLAMTLVYFAARLIIVAAIALGLYLLFKPKK